LPPHSIEQIVRAKRGVDAKRRRHGGGDFAEAPVAARLEHHRSESQLRSPGEFQCQSRFSRARLAMEEKAARRTRGSFEQGVQIPGSAHEILRLVGEKRRVWRKPSAASPVAGITLWPLKRRQLVLERFVDIEQEVRLRVAHQFVLTAFNARGRLRAPWPGT